MSEQMTVRRVLRKIVGSGAMMGILSGGLVACDARSEEGATTAQSRQSSSESSTSSSSTSASSTGRSISVNNNGERVSISESNDGISVSTSKIVDGLEQTTEVRSANLDELQKEHPEAFDLYHRYLGKDGEMSPAFQELLKGEGLQGLEEVIQGQGLDAGLEDFLKGAISGANQGTMTRTNRSVSVNENGNQVTVAEDGSGITVTTTKNDRGTPQKSVVRAKSAAELKQSHPDAFQTYEKYLGANGNRNGATASAKAFAGGGSRGGSTASSGGGGSRQGGQRSQNSGGRSISVSENGRSFTVAEDDQGISVTMSEMVEGQEQKSQVHAANAAELQRTNAAAFEVYQKYLGAK